MAPESLDSAHFAPLRVIRLRELTREARAAFPPDHVGKALRHRHPFIVDEDGEEIAPILEDLVRTAQPRLRDAGVEPLYNENGAPPKLAKRERDYVTNLGALYAYLAESLIAVGKPREALEAAHEGLAWSRTAGDHCQMAILYRAMASAHGAMSEHHQEEGCIRKALESARLSKHPETIIDVMSHLATILVNAERLDEGETVVEEALRFLRQELKDERGGRYARLLTDKARIMMNHMQYSESIRTLREGLRWAHAETAPMDRAIILAHLGSVYLRLQHHQLSIECQHEVVRLGDQLGSRRARGWGYYRLAEAHMGLGELETAGELLDRAEAAEVRNDMALTLAIASKRAYLLMRRGDYDEATAHCHWILETIGDRHFPNVEMHAYKTLADIEMCRERYENAIEPYRRAIEVSEKKLTHSTAPLKVYLANVYRRLERDNEALAILDAIAQADGMNQTEIMNSLRIRVAIAERQGDLRKALDYQREAFAIERSLLEERAADSLHNARIIAETDLLEREADAERERRRRLEHELADAIVELSDRKRMAEVMEQRLRKTLERGGADLERSTMKVLRETLTDIRAGVRTQESPLRYLSGVDEDFFRRLRSRCPDLTSKQERLCGLLRAGLASKEIANLMGLEAEGLKAQRKRLRKKLGLNPEERLETVLTEM